MPIGRPAVARIKVACATCGKSVEKYPSEVARNTSGRFFCSQECRQQLGRPKTAPRKTCEQCESEFVAYGKKPGRFCSKDCYDTWQRRGRVEKTCEGCGTTFWLKSSQTTHVTGRWCSRACEANSRIKRPLGREHNGRPAVLDRQGYVRVFQPDHPRATKAGWQFEHRIVVERALGRYLEPDEHVHHVNGFKGDNRLDNLKVLSHTEHSAITWNERQAKLDAVQAELDEYRRRFGPL